MEYGLWSVPYLIFLSLLIIINSNSKHVSAASYNLRNETDRLALLEFKQHILDDPRSVLESWNDTQHHCLWQGVTCNARHQRVTALNLRGKTLSGLISPHIGNLSFLKSIYLGENLFHGVIPEEMGQLFRLRYLNFSFNILSGEIPVNLSRCSHLIVLHIGGNNLEGKIPVQLGSLRSLEYLILQMNNLTGEIPNSLGNLSSLTVFSLVANNLEGSLPNELGLLKKLYYFSIGKNRLIGTFPNFLYNLSEITTIGLGENLFHGNLPNNIGFKMLNLKDIGVGGNKFHGKIPISFANATLLNGLDLSDNNFEGKVPYLGNLVNLRRLNIEMNLLGNNSSSDLNFLESLTNCTSLIQFSFAVNKFGGKLSHIIGNLSSTLMDLRMGGNMISGTIPVELGRLKNLYILSMVWNFFTGTIPNDIASLEKLQVLNFGRNMLSGPIPPNLFNITSLYSLRLAANNFGGTLSENIGNCRSLKIFDISRNNLTGVVPSAIFGMFFSPQLLDLSHNSLSGSLPREVGKLANINVLNVSSNKFTGEIPRTLGDCSNLEYLEMGGNLFVGTIPEQLASLKGLQYLDLSRNNLTGLIPRDLQRLTSLTYLNVSFNNLEGEISSKGVFGNKSQIMLTGNSKLCGGIPQLGLPSCFVHKKKKGGKLLVILVPLFLSIMVLILAVTFIYLFQRRRRVKKNSTMPSGNDKILRVSYQELHRATRGFSQEDIIGSGGYGIVYKGNLSSYKKNFVAIKVLDFQKIGAAISFKAECNALRNIRHRNLVALLTYCSSIDFKGRDFKALVYDFMENGSLDMWLHPKDTRSRDLNLLQRLNIAIDVASALDYLHNQCGSIIVHRDLKPSNILLDKNLVAHVGDFGLAKFLMPSDNVYGQDTSNTIAIKGTIGYAAPEYGMGGIASTRGDVYSYGILLLEMLTGKRPTDDAFTGDMDLYNYVKTNLSSEVQVIEIIDPFLLSRVREENTIEANKSDGNFLVGDNNSIGKCIISMFEIALKCSAKSSNDRMDMNEVLRQLQLIKDHFINAQVN